MGYSVESPECEICLIMILFSQRFSPLSWIGCMRLEAKNSHFTGAALSISNFKNVTKPVTTCHQRFTCYHFADSDIFENDATSSGKGVFDLIIQFFASLVD